VTGPKLLRKSLPKMGIKIDINDDTDVCDRKPATRLPGLNRMMTIVLQWLIAVTALGATGKSIL
jgi:hypothetical protein